MAKTSASVTPNAPASCTPSRCPSLTTQRRSTISSSASLIGRRIELLRCNNTRLPDSHLTSSQKALEVLQSSGEVNRVFNTLLTRLICGLRVHH